MIVLATIALSLPLEPVSTVASFAPVILRCESRVDPLGIDTPRPRLSWVLEGSQTVENQRQSAYRVLVASSESKLANHVGDLWDSGKVTSSAQNNISYRGRPLAAGERCYWKAMAWDGRDLPTRWSRTASWEMGRLADGWTAKWIGNGSSSPQKEEDFYADDPAPLFRKTFSTKKKVARARLSVAGLGYYEASINGVKVGDYVLDPGWTDYDKRVLYSVFDVTKLLEPGQNCIGAMLGNGWFNPLPMKMWGRLNLREHLTIGRPMLLAQLDIDYADGSNERIATDSTWKVHPGPILRNNVYLGEVYDARREVIGWDVSAFNDQSWVRAKEVEGPHGVMQSQPQPPIKVLQSWHANSVSEPEPGVFIYDCGENFAGWLSLELEAPTGTKIDLRFGELLNRDGTLNPMTSVAGQIKRAGVGGSGAPPVAWQSDTYISKGGKQSYTPRFTFHGFRYVEVRGLSHALPLKSLKAHRLGAAVESVGEFECSNPMLNEIQKMCRRTFRSNLFSVQSDCPHREKMGYGGDIASTSDAFMLNFDMANFYAKTVADFADSAMPDGMLTDTAPFMGIQYCGVVWAMAHPLLIDQLYRYYGDSRIAEEQYETAKKWLLLVQQQNPDFIIKDGLSDHEGLEAAPSPEMVTPLYYRSATILASIAKRVGKAEDEEMFADLAEKIRKAYQAKFVGADGKLGTGSQASQAIGLATGMALSPDASVSKLLAEIDAKRGHLSTGILGTKHMLDELSKSGYAQTAYDLVTKKDFPGWGWMLSNGATTLWEHWELSENTFSHNHPMFGSVSEWMMKWLGGIQAADDAAGFDQIEIRPQTVVGLDWVKSSYQSIRGRIVSNWKRVGERVRFEIEIPINCKANISLPGQKAMAVGSGKHVFLH